MSFTSSQIHLKSYFEKFPEFEYDESQETIEQFQILSTQQSWSAKECYEERKALKTALVLQFNDTYGEDEADLEGWQKLCRAIKLERVPGNVTACRKLFQRIHVNLVDLVDAQGTGRPVDTFPSEVALAEYTKETGKFFPRDDAEAGGLLRLLLRQIMNPGERDSRKHKSRRRKRGDD